MHLHGDAPDGEMIVVESGDLEAVVVAEREPSSTFITFAAYTIERRSPSAAPRFLRHNSEAADDLVNDPRHAEPLLIGQLDGDGCAEVRLGNDGVLHACHAEDVARFARVLERSVGVARELVDEEAMGVAH